MRHLSASQMDMFQTCPKKWWYQYVQKLPVPATKAKDFGTAVHALAEAYLKADINDRDPVSGLPADLYPQGWDAGLSPDEVTHAVTLVNTAINKGILTRYPLRKIEDKFSFETSLSKIVGTVDVLTPSKIIDHKTTANFRYAKKASELPTNIQMMLYAAKHLRYFPAEWGERPETLTLRHNVFSKEVCDDPMKCLRAVETEVTAEQVAEFWNNVITPLIYEMEKSGDCETCPDGPREKGACQKYKGCPFIPVCTGQMGTEQYRRHFQSLYGIQPKEAPISGSFSQTQQKEESMGLFNKTTAPPVNAPAPPSATEPPVPGPAPWAGRSCVACKGTGWNTRGNPCTACDSAARMKGAPCSDDFDWSSGQFVLLDPEKARGPAAPVQAPAPAPAPPPKVEIQEDAIVEPPAPAPAPAPEPAKRGRPVGTTKEKIVEKAVQAVVQSLPVPPTQKGLRIMCLSGVPCAMSPNASANVVPLEAFIEKFGCDIVKRLGGKGEDWTEYYGAPAFDRRDMLCKMAIKALETESNFILVRLHGSPDIDALASALASGMDWVIR